MRRFWGVTGLLTILLTTGAAAQQQPDKPAPSLLERMAPTPPASIHAQPRWNAEQRNAAAKQPNQPVLAARGESVALMVAGGALFVAGAIVGGDAGTLLMVGGAVVGAYGVYLYFR